MDDEHQGFRIVIRRLDGSEEEVSAHCDRVVLGSGAHCEIRLPVEYGGVEHVELTIVNGRIYARARSFDPAPTVGGSPFIQGFVEPGVEIGIGPLRIVASLAEQRGPTRAQASRTNASHTRMAAMAAVAFLLLVAVRLARKGQEGLAPGGVAPPLWSTTLVTCPQASPDRAIALGEERNRIAQGKRERRPFHVQDGVAAVPLFELASVCFATGRDGERSASSARAASELRAKVDEDYHAHQVRLEHALGIKDMPTARYEVAMLRAFTEGLSGPYVAWLADLGRALRTSGGKGAS